jgi:hypothetical protein
MGVSWSTRFRSWYVSLLMESTGRTLWKNCRKKDQKKVHVPYLKKTIRTIFFG